MSLLANIKTIAVAGAGTMGSGIAQLAAQSGFKTLLYDVSESITGRGMEMIRSNLLTALKKGKITEAGRELVLSRITAVSAISQIRADLIVEAVVERPEVKKSLFLQLSKNQESHCIYCSNTSSLSITGMAKDFPFPDRFAGLHFFNPPHLMNLVEVVAGEKSAEPVLETLLQLVFKMGKTPVRVKDSPGFIVNRIGKMYHTEALRLLEDGVADVVVIDGLLEATGFRMGPFRLMDLIGLDANLNVTRSLYQAMHQEERFRPSSLQQQMVEKGLLGRKSGKGFYPY